jgi:uracil-DNA glycosylase family 4
MSKNLKDEIIQSLIDQKEIFGDVLFEENIIKTRKTEIIKNTVAMEDTLFKEDWELTDNLEDLNRLICECQKCPLGETRNKFVFGTGNPNADAMCIGEGPGADEDAQGLPFVGRAGRLLTDILKAIKFEREEVYIANVVKCRPPGNRTPLPGEMDTCLPYLKKQIELIKPKVILCLGLTAAQGLLKKRDSLTNMRGKVFDFVSDGFITKVMVTYHPAALLRNPNWKRGCWEDVQKFRNLYDELAN